ncbi:excinuclease ABC subunit C [Candidatus Aerophobetes bacterium]|uniref:Excinuclease ABC subunit C n=1 Tax=Aerophobetes bacterium TaxID=2030807 RepID=A0A662D2P8_UNCAE|nr:MAG: excinuclease ABC subunit C [Candidatus Aerophobetes bacterium]
MPILKRWSSFRKENVIKEVPNFYGVYEVADGAKEVLYIGEEKVRDRLLAHFSGGSDPIPGVSYFRCETTRSKDRCVQRQNALLAEYKRGHDRLPKFNQKRRA